MSGWYRGLRPAVASVLAVIACAVPASVHADEANPYVFVQASVCTITSLTITTGTPVSAVSTAPTSFGVTAQGSCVGDPPGSLFLSGSGVTDGPATCEGFVTLNGAGVISVGTSSGPVSIDIAGLTAAPLMVLAMSQTGLTGTAALSLSPVSLEACLLGGTSILQYSGTSVFAL